MQISMMAAIFILSNSAQLQMTPFDFAQGRLRYTKAGVQFFSRVPELSVEKGISLNQVLLHDPRIRACECGLNHALARF